MGEHPRALRSEGLPLRLAPFGGVAVLAVGTFFISPVPNIANAVEAGSITVLVIALGLVVRWDRLPAAAEALPPLAAV